MKIHARSRLRTVREQDDSTRHARPVSAGVAIPCVSDYSCTERHPYMDVPIWTSLYGHPYMDVHIWTSLYGHPYRNVPIGTSLYVSVEYLVQLVSALGGDHISAGSRL